MSILIADDDALLRRLTQRTLEEAGHDVIVVDNGNQAVERLFRRDGPRLAVLDWVMPGLDGPSVCRAARSRVDQPYIYLILLTSKESKADLVAGLEAGADDYLTKPWNREELKARTKNGLRILRLHDRLFHDARHDALTRLPNRMYFIDRLDQCARRSEETMDYKFAVLFVDINRFKSINDSLGHSAGDRLIVQAGARILESTQFSDSSLSYGGCMVARLGGDEFTVLIDGLKEGSDVMKFAERIRTDFDVSFTIAGHRVLVGASVGVSLSATGGSSAEDMLRDADLAMYRAKVTGRPVSITSPSAQVFLLPRGDKKTVSLQASIR